MKLFISALAAVAFASAAHATPAVGDQVVFRGTWGTDPIEQKLAFTEFNASTKQFKQTTVTTVSSATPASQEDLVNFDSTASDAALQEIVTKCASLGGVAETVTVPAGAFPTCKKSLSSGGFVHLGVVPFGVVRMETSVDGKALVMELVSVTRGT
jgi:hypothetical protein